jgi:hypothetical protein
MNGQWNYVNVLLKYVSALPKDASFGAKAKYLVLGSV